MSNSCKVLWISDVHLGFKQYGLERRADDFVVVHTAALKLAAKYKANCIIDTGDLLHSSRPSPDVMMYLRQVNATLEDNEMPYFLIAGNHDATPDTDVHWVDTIGGNSGATGGIKLIDGKTVEINGIKIYGIGHLSKEEFLKLKVPEVDIVAIHAPVQEFIPFTSSSVLTLNDLPLDKAQLVALGDIHITDIRNIHGTHVGYTGSTELNSESEPFDKVAQLVTFEKGKLTKMEPVKIPTRPIVKTYIKNAEELEAWLCEIEQFYGRSNRKPICFISFPDTLEVMTQCRARLNPNDYILRFKSRSATAAAESNTSNIKYMTALEYMRQVMKPPTELVGVITELLNPEASAGEALDEFIDTL